MITKEMPNNLFFANIRHIIDSGNSAELVIKGTSMHPTLVDGKHKVVLKPCNEQCLRVGTLALFLYKGKHILHRLVSIDANRLTFRGDNLITEECINREDVIAVVAFIITPTGKVIDCAKQSFFIKNSLRKWKRQYYIIPGRRLKGYVKKLIRMN
ncbi:hypothetical protein [Bacteroides sp. 519]|uniref:hypothetical protein n=1 Tax=Bacteroides sp. 519 TaxID=2302937 RepID=UPI0013D4B423|nr:hypothetical protein [Bacteroides sp. 519]NDV60226.1 hypothetical protein [Bacteroides sp. 519]